MISRKNRQRFHRWVKYGINALFIKNRRKLFFESFPDYSDNSRAFSDFLLNNGFIPKYKMYWAVDSLPNYRKDGIHFILKKNKWQYFYHTITSYYLFSTHGSFDWCNPYLQKYVCFWHGTMLKKICQMQNPENTNYLRQAWKFVAPSEFYVKFYSQCFGRKNSDILVLGYPRCDLLFHSSDSLQQLGIELDNGTKVVVYMPTFRQPISGTYSDSNKNVFEEDFIRFSDSVNVKQWDSFLKEKNVCLIVKPHPSDKNVIKCNDCDNIRVITDENLKQSNVQLYSLLANAHALITDYSSVYCDYLLLDRPIGFIVTDIKDYGQGRGFVFSNPLDYMPGFIITTETEFIEFFDDIYQGKDRTKTKRNMLQTAFNKFHDGKNCERIAETIGLSK